MWKIASLPRTFGEAFQKGFGTPSKFISNASEMLQGVGEFWLEVGPQSVGTKLKNIPAAILPGEGREAAREALWGMETRLFKQLLKELASEKPEKILRLEEQLRAETDPHQIEILRYALGEAHESWRPVMSFMGDEFLYFTDKHKLMNKIANNPAEFTADIIAGAKLLRGGVKGGGLALGLKGIRVGAKLQKASKILKVIEVVGDPPSGLGKGKHLIDSRVRSKKQFGVEKPDVPKGELPGGAVKEALKPVGEEVEKIGKSKGKSLVTKSKELEKKLPDDETDDGEEGDGNDKEAQAVGGDYMSLQKWRVH